MTCDDLVPHATPIPNLPWIIGIAGLSYCGSTILNLVLDGHHQVFGGGELHWLLRPRQRGREPAGCRTCGQGCSYWSRIATGENSLPGFYSRVAEVFDVKRVVDASKNVRWFQRLDREGVPARVTFLVKHPLRHAASFATNTRARYPLLSRRTLRHPHGLFSARWRSADYALDELCLRYRALVGSHASLVAALDAMFDDFAGCLRYEDFVAEPQRALEGLLTPLDLNFEPEMLNYAAAAHHPVGGNWGPSLQTSAAARARRKLKESPEFRRRYYEQATGLQIDNKFVAAFGLEVCHRLMEDPRMAELESLLGYTGNVLSFPVRTVLAEAHGAVPGGRSV